MPGKTPPKVVATRQKAMTEMRESGMSLQKIGAEYGLSKERIRQIIGHGRKYTECKCCKKSFPSPQNSGFCTPKCYKDFRQYGKPKPSYLDTVIEKITNKIDVTEKGCWEWRGSTNPIGGYGQMNWRSRYIGVHRIMWWITYGTIQEGECVLHSCDNPPCVSPYHLFLGTHKDNAKDRTRKKRHIGPRNFTDQEVETIKLFYNSASDARWLAKSFGVHPGTIYKIVKGKTYTGKPQKQRKDKGIASGRVTNAKLTPSHVLRIRDLYSYGHHSFHSLALMYGVKYNAIYKIIQRRTWVHI